ncbi:MAG: CvpA family protein [Clostridiales bacterium]|nr:CvpA family protein [Clostridiales bacterium]
MLSIIIDIILLIILALFIRGGYKKGFILGVSSVIALIIAFYGAGLVAGAYSHKFTPMLEPIISGIVDKSVSETKKEYSEDPTQTPEDKNELDTIGMGSLLNLGIFKGTASKIIEELKDSISDVGQSFKAAVASRITESVTYIITFIVVFLLIIILFSIVANLLNLACRLPGLELLNNAGGIVLGAVKGLLVLFALAWAMRYCIGVFPEDTLDKTYFLRFLMSNNLLTAFLGV